MTQKNDSKYCDVAPLKTTYKHCQVCEPLEHLTDDVIIISFI